MSVIFFLKLCPWIEATSQNEWANQINCTSCNRITSSFACDESELSLICGADGWRIKGRGLMGTGMPSGVYAHSFSVTEMDAEKRKRWDDTL